MLTYNYVFGLYGRDNKNTIYRVQDKSNQEHKTNTIEDKILIKFLSTISSKSAYYSFSSELHSSLNLTGYTHMSSPIRRLVDLIGQEVYYTGSSNIISRNPNILDIVNRQSKLIKQLERDMNKIALAHMAYYNNEQNKYISYCYLYRVDIDRNRKYLYFPKENISIVDHIIHPSVLKSTYINVENNILIITSDIVNSQFPINKLTEVIVYGSPDIFNIDSSIIISN
jgi:exoribonuclease R